VPDTYRRSFPGGLDGFLEQTLDPQAFELVLVDWEGGPSYLPLVESARAHPRAPRIAYLRGAQRGRAALNNLAVARAAAPILCFCADDFIPGRGYAEAHLAFHAAHPDAGDVAIGPGVATPEMRRASPFLAWLEDSGELFGARFQDPSAELPAGYFYIANCSLKRALYEQAGPFDERLLFPAHDDLDYGRRLARLGMRSELVPAARCIHDHLVTLPDRRAQLEWAGTSEAILAPAGARRLVRLHLQTLRAWLRAARRDGPRVAWWRWSLASAFLSAYRRQLRSRER
jgi:GT2 family glycosyltransferase